MLSEISRCLLAGVCFSMMLPGFSLAGFDRDQSAPVLIEHTRSDLVELPIAAGKPQFAMSMYNLYERNRAEGIPNYITEDFVLVNYSLLHAEIWKDVEDKQLLPAFQSLVKQLAKRVKKQRKDDATSANKQFLAILAGLLSGEDRLSGYKDDDPVQIEYRKILNAAGAGPSSVWGQTIDYTQFKPRGAYTRSEEAQRYFRAMRYAGTVLFAVTASGATGVDDATSDRLVTQASRLINLLENEEKIAKQYQFIMNTLGAVFGQADDASNETFSLVISGKRPVTPELRALLAKTIREKGEEPRILGGIVDRNALEEGQTAQQVLAGWRFMPQRYTSSSAVFQGLVYDATGKYTGKLCEGCDTPVGLTTIDGKAVKGFPLLNELMSMLGSKVAASALDEKQEGAFDGYSEAFRAGQQTLAQATGLQRARLRLMQTGLSTTPNHSSLAANRLTALKAFWTWDRYTSLLYAKQSYTMISKSVNVNPERAAGGWLDPSVELYRGLRDLVSLHYAEMPDPRWESFGKILDKLIDIAYQERLVGRLGGEAGDYLNELDKELFRLVGKKDQPIVVDIHTNAASEQVLEEAVGPARVIELQAADSPGQVITFAGARFTQCEFKQPMAERMTVEEWQALLREGKRTCGPVVNADTR